MTEWLIPVAILLAIAGLFAWRYTTGKRDAKYLASIEYWVYAQNPKRPEDKIFMDRMISGNPHNLKGRQIITQREGLLFADVRLHIAVVRREKNPHAFRPDLFEQAIEPTPEVLSSLAACKGLVRIKFSSKVKLQDKRHLVFMPHAADAIAELVDAKVVYDLAQERLYSAAEFHETLSRCKSEESGEIHVRTVWCDEPDGSGYARSFGLRKVGLADLRTEDLDADQQALACHLVEAMAERSIADMQTPERLDIDHFGARFIATAADVQDELRTIKLSRILNS